MTPHAADRDRERVQEAAPAPARIRLIILAGSLLGAFLGTALGVGLTMFLIIFGTGDATPVLLWCLGLSFAAAGSWAGEEVALQALVMRREPDGCAWKPVAK